MAEWTLPTISLPGESFARCKHGVAANRCLSIECLNFNDIPVRGEKSWDSALQPHIGGPFPNLHPWLSSLTFRLSPGLSPGLSRYSLSASRFPPEPEATVRQMPVIGYRGWRVREVERPLSIGPRVAARGSYVELVSLNEMFGGWVRGAVSRARCRMGEKHKAPAFGCSCGLHVLANLADAPRWYGEHGVPVDVVVGAVVGWGEVIQHGDEGWRAEFARPIALLKTDIFEEQPLLDRAAQDYGLPILERKGLELYAREYGERFTAAQGSSRS